MTISVYNMTGWHTAASNKNEGMLWSIPKYNLVRVLGYVPLGGILTGILDIVMAVNEKDLATRVYGIVRGILEIIGLGLLFIIPDAAVSVHRHFCAEPNAKKV